MSVDPSKSNKRPQAQDTGIELPQGASTASDVPEGVFEDVYRFWKDHGARLLTYLVVVLVAFLAVQGWKQYSRSREASLKDQFSKLETIDAKVDFAHAHKGHALASFAYLQAGKDAYETGDFTEAAELYANAAEGLEDTDLLPIALLGQASSLRKAGDSDGAAVVLEALAAQDQFAEGIRAEAMFKRIVIALENDQDTVVEDFTRQLESTDTTQIWIQRLEGIQYYQ